MFATKTSRIQGGPPNSFKIGVIYNPYRVKFQPHLPIDLYTAIYRSYNLVEAHLVDTSSSFCKLPSTNLYIPFHVLTAVVTVALRNGKGGMRGTV